MSELRLSIVIPVYFGAKTVEPLVEKVFEHLSDYETEIVLVNDGSTDDSPEVCTRLAEKHSTVTFVNLRKNFGEHSAVMCGLNHVTGDCAIIIDDDFQNPPSEILKLVEVFKEGHDVVYSYYAEKKHSAFRNFGSRFNDWTATVLLKKPKDLYLSSFKLVSRGVVDEIVKYKGPFPYIDGLILRVTRSIGRCQVDHHEREEGKSTYTLAKLISLHLDMFFNFSVLPLRVCSICGFGAFVLGILFSCVFALEKLWNPDLPLGWASLMTAVLVLSGVQLVAIGVLGEYLGKQYLDHNGTPQWVIRDVVLNRFHSN